MFCVYLLNMCTVCCHLGKKWDTKQIQFDQTINFFSLLHFYFVFISRFSKQLEFLHFYLPYSYFCHSAIANVNHHNIPQLPCNYWFVHFHVFKLLERQFTAQKIYPLHSKQNIAISKMNQCISHLCYKFCRRHSVH